jgi:hypothetical protein
MTKTKQQETAAKTKATGNKPNKEEQALVKQSQTMIAEARKFVVNSAETCQIAEDRRKIIRESRKKWKALLGPVLDACKEALDTARDRFKIADDPLKESDGIYKLKVRDYVDEQERIDREKKRKQEAEAKTAAEQKAEEERIERAQKLMDDGKMDEAEELLSGELDVEPVKVRTMANPDLPKVDKRFLRKVWRADVVDFKALVDAVAKGEVPIGCVEPNQSFLNKQAGAFRDTDALNYPGVAVRYE